ncbi:MAG: bifunctional phosphopantothenoylcysteine decarboxylase/phosphopantothenate--cysteine ligase CoaBC [Candidatus Omnitrophica bacterium]|nr:bifunctional phosphopantothenoylcysteine decarboxylase/phosphopantothenate--cysteine ligase CoaBC [Candidatus Omnitrophota bacterium]
MKNKKKEIILGVTASIAIYKACQLIRQLKEEGFSVTVVMSKEAGKFIRPLVFQSLSGNKVYQGLFAPVQTWEIEHVALADKANLVLVAPATANIIGKLASGIYDDLLTCIISATRAPVLICPAMNENMYKNKVVQDNIKRLKLYGYRFVEPKIGRLACGRKGWGRLAEPDEIIKEVKRILKNKSGAVAK